MPPSTDQTQDSTPHNHTTPQNPRPREPVLAPNIVSSLTPDDAMKRARQLSKAGQLPGYEPDPNQPHTFTASIFGGIYDHTLHAHLTPTTAEKPAGSHLAATVTLDRRTPLIIIIATVFTVWPGVWLFHSLLTTYFGWYPKPEWITWAWYVPLCLLSIPVLWKQYKSARLEARAHTLEILERLRDAVDGQFEDEDA